MVVGTAGLSVTTDSPDALCPPLSEARSVIHARVGQVQGGTYEARYRTVLDAENGRNVLHLVLEDEEEVLLVREIPLEGTDCADAALAMAMVLERYFASAFQLEPSHEKERKAPHVPPKPESPAATSQKAPSEREVAPLEAQPDSNDALRAASSAARKESTVFLRGHLGMSTRNAVQMGVGAELWLRHPWTFHMETRFQLFRTRLVSNGYALVSSRHAILGGSSYLLRLHEKVAMQLGPNLGAQFQVAQVMTEDVQDARSRLRVAPSVGAHLFLTWELTSRLQLGAMGRFLTLLPGSRFTVGRGESGDVTVLPLPQPTAEFGVSWGIRL